MTWEARMNPSPFTVMVKAGPPATAEVGLMPLLAMVGETTTMGKLTALDMATPGVDTVIGATAVGSDQVYGNDGGQLSGTDEGGSERGAEIDPKNGGALNEALAGDGQGDGRSAGQRGCRAEAGDGGSKRIGGDDELEGIGSRRRAGVFDGDDVASGVVHEVGGHGGGQVVGGVVDGGERRAIEEHLGSVDEIRASDVQGEGGAAGRYIIRLNHRERSRSESDGQGLRDGIGGQVGDEQGYGIVAGQGQLPGRTR